MSALSFAWESAGKIHSVEEYESEGKKTYRLHGALFFASINTFHSIFNPRNNGRRDERDHVVTRKIKIPKK